MVNIIIIVKSMTYTMTVKILKNLDKGQNKYLNSWSMFLPEIVNIGHLGMGELHDMVG